MTATPSESAKLSRLVEEMEDLQVLLSKQRRVGKLSDLVKTVVTISAFMISLASLAGVFFYMKFQVEANSLHRGDAGVHAHPGDVEDHMKATGKHLTEADINLRLLSWRESINANFAQLKGNQEATKVQMEGLKADVNMVREDIKQVRTDLQEVKKN